MSFHHGNGDEILHLHFFPTTEEDQAISLHWLELQLNTQVIMDVGQRRIGDV